MGIALELGGAVLEFGGKRDCFMTKPTKDEIRTSRDADFKAIADWLREERNQGVHGNFYCNLNSVENSHARGDLLVYVDGATGCPVAFQLGGLIRPGILEVKHDMRGRVSAPSWNSSDSAGLKSGIGGVFLAASSSA